jgi:diaminohydroxyphosphoribosylaminopyrimidine deaminase/5-amino-6-(5-phosphoribosylamino)uracil reductase
VTVSDCLAAGLLDRLQIAVAPVMIGGGRTGVTLPRSDAMAQALRPKVRIYRMGSDVLYDFDLSVACGAESSETDSAGVGIRRLL